MSEDSELFGDQNQEQTNESERILNKVIGSQEYIQKSIEASKASKSKTNKRIKLLSLSSTKLRANQY